MLIVLYVLFSIIAASPAVCALFERPTECILNKAYDYIVIGAGAGGSVMAARLSEDAGTRVLLIEAGGSDYANQNILVPSFAPRLSLSQFDWNFTTTSQPGLHNRSIAYPRGHVLGGSTAINQMAYSRGTRDDFDRWANVTGDDGWSWNKLLHYILKMEKLTPPADHHNTTGQLDSEIHGTNGPVGTSVEGSSLPIDHRVLNASAQLSDQFPFNLDYNSGDTVGIGWTQSTIESGRRVTAATSYLAKALNRSNLDVLVNTQVTKVLPVGNRALGPDMRGVQFSQSPNDTTYTLMATKELILSAGAVKTPQLLMLSGIGSAAYLQSMGIKPLVDLPAIGQNLQDHVFLGSSWTVNSNNTFDSLRLNSTFSAGMLELWQVNGTGSLGLGPANQLGWFRVPANSSIFDNATDPSAGPTSAHYEFIPSSQFISKSIAPPSGHFFTMLTNVVSPSSRGNISLASLNPFDAPLINPNLLGTDLDVGIMVEAVKAARIFMETSAWDGYITGEFGDFANARTDDEIAEYVRANSDTVDHVVGTAAMGPRMGSGALNPDLTVKGTVGLRVVDASAFPFVISGHTQAPTYIVAERAADIVRGKQCVEL